MKVCAPPEQDQHPACRLDIAHGDWHAVKHNIEKASRLCEEGGDWERKNRLKVSCDFSATGTRCGNCGQESQGQSTCSVSEHCCCA